MATENEARRRGFRDAPILVFSVVGGALFWLAAPHVPWGREAIHVDTRTVAEIVERQTSLLGRELSAEERERAIERYVRDEMLLREAYRNGWHLENGRVRQRLVAAMRGVMSEDVPEPSLAQLRAYFQARSDRYRVPAAVTLSHVFFEDEPPENVLEALRSGADFEAIGDRFVLGSTLTRQTELQLRGALGPTFARSVVALDSGVWSGPIRSSQGYHFVRVEAHHPPELPEFDTMRRFVRVDWETERRREIGERKMSRIRERYTIVEP